MRVKAGGQGRYADIQFDPFAGAIFGELGHEQPAVIQILAARLKPTVGVGRIPVGIRDILVEVVKAVVVTHVPGDGTAFEYASGFGTLVQDTAHARALDRSRGRVVRVDLDQPAEGIGCVAVVQRCSGCVGRRVPASELAVLFGRIACHGGPLVAESGGAQAVTRLFFGDRVFLGRQIALEVLLGGQIGAPRREAATAVVDGAARAHAGGVVSGDHQVGARNRTGQIDGRGGRDASVKARVGHRPLAVHAAHHLHDRHAVGVDVLADFVGVGGLAVGVLAAAVPGKQGAVGILVVDHQQSVV